MIWYEPIALKVIEALSGRASLCRLLFAAWARLPPRMPLDARSLVASAGLGLNDEQGTQLVLNELARLGLAVRQGESYVAADVLQAGLGAFAVAFAGIDHYREHVHRDRTLAQVVLTRPELSTALELRLVERGWRLSAIESTDQAFLGIVRCARQRLVVMTPFLDDKGAVWLKQLIGHVATGVAVTLVLRGLEDPARADAVGYAGIRAWLTERCVRVVNYGLLRHGGGRESFHAKVILGDRDRAYVGSANVTGWSLDYSMELGVVLEGQAAAQIAEVVEAVLQTATPWAA
jgi:phosphatidylserine/phosphatidylglycerophosphate/cardiolipin synthase-like enzyme